MKNKTQLEKTERPGLNCPVDFRSRFCQPVFFEVQYSKNNQNKK